MFQVADIFKSYEIDDELIDNYESSILSDILMALLFL